jgi:hypothetical protein
VSENLQLLKGYLNKYKNFIFNDNSNVICNLIFTFNKQSVYDIITDIGKRNYEQH